MKWYWTIYLLDFTVWSYLCKLQSMHAWSLQRGDHSYYSLFIFSTSLVFDVLMFTFKVDFFLRNNSKLIKHIIHLISFTFNMNTFLSASFFSCYHVNHDSFLLLRSLFFFFYLSSLPHFTPILMFMKISFCARNFNIFLIVFITQLSISVLNSE